MLGKILIELLIIGICCLSVASLVALTRSRNTSRLFELESEAVKFSESVVIVGIIWQKPMLSHASIMCVMLALVNLVTNLT